MSLRDQLLNGINTTIRGGQLDSSNLINTGISALDRAFKPHQNTNSILNLDAQLENIRMQQSAKMKLSAHNEQNKIAIDKINEALKNKEKNNNELGFNLFTNNGTNLNGNEETFRESILKDVKRQTGRNDLTIDDLIRNVNDPQLSLSSDVKNRINNYAEYKYNKNKIDNKVLDNNEIDELASLNYDQFALVGQDLNTFRSIFENNNNSFKNILSDKAKTNLFKQLNSDRDLKEERLFNILEELKKQNNSNGQPRNNINQTNIIKKTNNINNPNPEDNFQNLDDNANNIKQIQEQVDGIANLSDVNIRSTENLQKIYDLISENPSINQPKLVDYIFSTTGVDKLSNDKLYKEHRRSVLGAPIEYTAATDDANFIIDLSSYARTGNMLDIDLNDYNYKLMNTETKRAYQTVKDLKDIEFNKYTEGFSKIDDIVKDPNYNYQNMQNNINEDYKYYDKIGNSLLSKDENLEKKIKPSKNGIFQEGNGGFLWFGGEDRKLHNNGKDIQFLESNNILKNLYDTSSDELVGQTVYYATTSDSVIKERQRYMLSDSKSKHSLANILKNPIEREEAVRDMQVALSKAFDNIDAPIGTDLPNTKDLAFQILLVDSVIIPNIKYFRQNPSALGKSFSQIANTVNPNNFANNK